jgi:transposase
VGTQDEVIVGQEASGKGVRSRKRRPVQEKLQIVRETLQSEASVAVIARRHGVNANQVFTWRRQYHRGQLKARMTRRRGEAMIVPVEVRAPSSVPAAVTTEHVAQRALAAEQIEIEFPSGMRLRVRGAADAAALQTILRELSRPC